jgi:hypothetical protein
MLYFFYIFQPAEMFPGLERQWKIYVSIQLLFEVVVIFCVQCLRLEVIVYFIDTGGMVDHCYLTFLFIIK